MPCSTRSAPSILSSQRWFPRYPRWHGRSWLRPKTQRPQRRSARSLCKRCTRPPTKVQPPRRRCGNTAKKLEAAKETLEDFQAKTLEMEDTRKEAYEELTCAHNGVSVQGNRPGRRGRSCAAGRGGLAGRTKALQSWRRPSAMLSLASRGDGQLRILSANISTWDPQAEGFLRSLAMGRFHLGAISICKLDKLWEQTGFRGTAAAVRKTGISTLGTSGGT